MCMAPRCSLSVSLRPPCPVGRVVFTRFLRSATPPKIGGTVFAARLPFFTLASAPGRHRSILILPSRLANTRRGTS